MEAIDALKTIGILIAVLVPIAVFLAWVLDERLRKKQESARIKMEIEKTARGIKSCTKR